MRFDNMVMVMFHFNALFKYLLHETEKIVAVDIPHMKCHVYHV